MTDPQTAADAAERVQAFLDARRATGDTRKTIASVEPDPCAIPARIVRLIEADVRMLLEDRKRMAAELEQVRSDWLTQAAQLNRIAGMVGHALILRACDDATSEEVRLALARACEDVHDVIGESEATRAQRTERYLVMCANLLNDHAIRERDVANERAEYAIGLLIAITSPDSCMVDGFKRCLVHGEDLSSGNDCPQALARAFLAGATAHCGAEKDPDARHSAARDATERGVAPEGSVS